MPPSFRTKEITDVSGLRAAYVFIAEEFIEVWREHATSIFQNKRVY
jgi:hypothetical protein